MTIQPVPVVPDRAAHGLDEYGNRVNVEGTAVQVARDIADGIDPSLLCRDSGVGPGTFYDPDAGTVTVRAFPPTWPGPRHLVTVDGVTLQVITVPVPDPPPAPPVADLTGLPRVAPPAPSREA